MPAENRLVGHVESLWRYPVKSMRGEQLAEAYLSFTGISGDRLYAFHYSKAPEDFPYFTARQRPEMLLYQATHHDGGSVLVDTPSRQTFAIQEAPLISQLGQDLEPGESITLLHSQEAMTDAHPVSLFSLQTARQLEIETEMHIDKRRFRANIYVDLLSPEGFLEDRFVGHKLMIGSQAVLEIIERDPRCKMITLDPDTTQASPEIIRQLARAHDTKAGIYAAVLVEGIVKGGDEIRLSSSD